MPDSDHGSITRYVELIRQGNEEAAARLWERFVPRLLGLATQILSSHPRLNGFADDVVQSAFGSFFHRARVGHFSIENRDNLWSLLATLTARKARHAIRREKASKRGGGHVHNEESLPGQGELSPRLDDFPGRDLDPHFDLVAEELLAGLPEELRAVTVLRLMGFTNQEVARQLDWTVRKVERKLHLIRLIWEKEIPPQ